MQKGLIMKQIIGYVFSRKDKKVLPIYQNLQTDSKLKIKVEKFLTELAVKKLKGD